VVWEGCGKVTSYPNFVYEKKSFMTDTITVLENLHPAYGLSLLWEDITSVLPCP
jgi:hypothetical protein